METTSYLPLGYQAIVTGWIIKVIIGYVTVSIGIVILYNKH